MDCDNPKGTRETTSPSSVPEIRHSYLGHKGRTFDVRYSAAKKRILSASEDGTCKVWDCLTHKCYSTMIHNKDAEVLRATFLEPMNSICTAGSDGNAVIWKEHHEGSKLKMRKAHVLEHGKDSQIYACEQMLHDTSKVLMAADNKLIIWDMITLQPSQTCQFDQIMNGTASEAFGGARNSDNIVFVFDAKVNPSQGHIVGAAMSDASIRLIDTRTDTPTISSRIFALSDSSTSYKLGHATSISWNSDATTLSVSLGSGCIALLDLRMNTVRALLHGHDGPCYGTMFVNGIAHNSTGLIPPNNPSSSSSDIATNGNDENTRTAALSASIENVEPVDLARGKEYCVSWSSDSTIRLWDINNAVGLISTPARVFPIPNFPILCACAAFKGNGHTLICGGGAGNNSTGPMGAFSFIGTPIHAIDNILL